MLNQNKEQNLILEFILVSISAVLFWYITGLFDGSGFGTDMGRYFDAWNFLADKFELNSVYYIFSGELSFPDPFNFLIQYGFKIIGFSFYAFLLLVTFAFYKGFTHRLNILFGKRIMILQIFTVLFCSSFLLISVYTALRHAIALTVILFFCIQTIDEKIGSKKFCIEFFITIFATLLHLSSVLLIPFLFLKKIFKRYIKLYNLLFFSIFIFYISGFISKFAYLFSNPLLSDFGFIFRALSVTEADGNYYVVGPTFLKALSIISPILIIEITKKYYTNYQKINLEPLTLFYKYISIITMLLSNLPYNDRILMIGWLFIPVMLSLPFYVIIKYMFLPLKLKVKN